MYKMGSNNVYNLTSGMTYLMITFNLSFILDYIYYIYYIILNQLKKKSNNNIIT